MRFVISSSDLLKAVLTVSKAIPSKTTEAILETYLFDLHDQTLSITASDNEITLKTDLEVIKNEEEGKMAIPARQMTELLKELPDQPLTIYSVTDSSFKCDWASGESSLPYFNPDDYPQVKTVGEESASVVFNPESLADGIAGTVYAASDEESRPIMSSIFFDIKKETTTLVASDLQKLICYVTDDVQTENECNFVLNKRHANILKGIIGKDCDQIKATFDDKTVVFSFGNTSMISRLVVGKYPDYKTIIPQNNSNILRISRTQLLNTVRRIAVCSSKGSNHLKFELAPGMLKVSAQDAGFELAAHEQVSCRYDGDELVIGFKSTHLTDILSNLSCDEIIMKFADRRRSALILPSEEEAATQKIFGIVMPVAVK